MKKLSKKRAVLVGWIFIVLLFALVIRLGHLQIVRGEELRKQAAEQQAGDRMIRSKRGDILDRNGTQLAI